MVMEVVQEQAGEEGSNVHCKTHPYRNNSTGGGICAFCLQEKLGNLVSSTYHSSAPPVFPSSPSSSSPSPSLRSHSTLQAPQSGFNHNGHSADKKTQDPTSIVFNRSKSLAAPKGGVLDGSCEGGYGPHRRGFWTWSFLYSLRQRKNLDSPFKDLGVASSTTSGEKKRDGNGGSPDETRKVLRSRSVRGLPGDLFERLTGFGDCTLRRVESHREGKVKAQSANKNDCIKERVSCGRIFNGFMVGPPSSSSYWVASEGHVRHSLSKSWGWAFASPMRAFGGRPKRGDEASSSKNGIPSLLAVSG